MLDNLKDLTPEEREEIEKLMSKISQLSNIEIQLNNLKKELEFFEFLEDNYREHTGITDVVQHEGIFCCVDSVYTIDNGFETVVFFCDPDGGITVPEELYVENYDSYEEMQERHKKIVSDLGTYLPV